MDTLTATTWMTLTVRDWSRRWDCFYCHQTLNNGDRITSKHGQPQCARCHGWEHRSAAPPALLASRPAGIESDRSATIKTLRRYLRERSGKDWSVRGGRGTAHSWIEIRAPKDRAADEYGRLTVADQVELAVLLGLDRPVYAQGVSIPGGFDYRRYYLDLAAGRPSQEHPQRYWD